jgi:hypothetical protein
LLLASAAATEGATVSASLSRSGGASPGIRVIFDLAHELDAARRDALVGMSSSSFRVEVSGRTMTMTSAAPEEAAGGAPLGGEPLFKQAFAGAGGRMRIVFYANLQRMLPAGSPPLKAIGLWQGSDEAGPSGGFRVIMK